MRPRRVLQLFAFTIACLTAGCLNTADSATPPTPRESDAGEGPRTRVACASSTGAVRFEYRPRDCGFSVRGADPSISANRVDVEGLRWRSWGRRVARGSGTFVGNMDYRNRVRVTLSSGRSCDGRRRYGRVVVRADGVVQSRFRLATCAGRRG